MKKHIAVASALVFILAGCIAGTTLRSRQKYITGHPEITAEVRDAILAGLICMSMTEGEVVASIGFPNRVNRSTYSFGTTAQFCYDDIGYNFNFNRYRYVYFENGKVTSWQQ